jgi:hypothetical protein
MNNELFQNLLTLTQPIIKRKNRFMRGAVSAEERLAMTLRYFTIGNSYEDLKFSTAVSPQLLGRIPETCTAVCEEHAREYLKVSNKN